MLGVNLEEKLGFDINDIEGGYTDVVQPIEVMKGDDAKIGIYANFGYMILELTVDGVPVTDIDSLYNAVTKSYDLVIDNVSKDMVVTIVYIRSSYNIKITMWHILRCE